MHPVRRVLLLVLSIGFMVGGAYLLYRELECLLGFLGRACSVRGFGIVAAVFLVVLGVGLLWDDFVRPWFSTNKGR